MKKEIQDEILTEEVKEKYSHISNKQSMARRIRYDFYKQIANELEITKVFLGHHKDDFIETAIMQESRSNDLPFYGIEKINKI